MGKEFLKIAVLPMYYHVVCRDWFRFVMILFLILKDYVHCDLLKKYCKDLLEF